MTVVFERLVNLHLHCITLQKIHASAWYQHHVRRHGIRLSNVTSNNHLSFQSSNTSNFITFLYCSCTVSFSVPARSRHSTGS